MTIDNDDQLTALQTISTIVSETLAHMMARVEPGMTTRELDAIGRARLDHHGARSAPELVYDFPGATCISVNDEVAHGIPGDRIIQAGDLVNIDVSAEKDGFFADTGASSVVPPAPPKKTALCLATRKALEAGVTAVRAGRPINRIGAAIESSARQGGYSIVRNLGGHGVGSALHEEPAAILHYYEPADRRRLQEGMVITIEPFLSTGATAAWQSDDGWTLCTEPGFLTAQFEHTLVVTRDGPRVLTYFH